MSGILRVMENIGSILSGKRLPSPPAEIAIIKSFVRDKLDEPCRVRIDQATIQVIVAHGTIANELRSHIVELQEQLATDKRLRVSIGSVVEH